MAHVQKVQKKTSSMSLTISSSASSTGELSSSSSLSSSAPASRHSSLVQQSCVSPERTESRNSNEDFGNEVAATFVKCLQDVYALRSQLVVLECRLRGTPPLQVTWYREDEQILDSDDFRILRKKANSASVPEELCTLVITEAFPEDSGLFTCIAHNSFGTDSCSAMLDVYNDLEEQLEIDAIRQQEAECFMESNEADVQLDNAPLHTCEDFPTVLPDPLIAPPPATVWPSSSLEDVASDVGFQENLLVNHSSEDHFSQDQCSEVQRSPEVTVYPPSPHPPSSPLPPAQGKGKHPTPKLFTPSKLLFNSSPLGGNTMNLSDLPTFKPGAFPPSAFNYARPRHFIQSQSAFQVPSYESVIREAQENQNNCQENLTCSKHSSSVPEAHSQTTRMSSHSQSLSKSLSQSQSQFQSLSFTPNQTQPNGTSKSSPSSSSLSSPTSTSSAAPPHSFVAPSSSRVTMRSSITLTPSIPSASGLGSATLPANQNTMSAPAAYLCSVLPSQSSFSSYSKLSPNSTPCSSTSPSRSPRAPSSPHLPVKEAAPSSAPQQPSLLSPSCPYSNLSPTTSLLPQPNTPNSPNRESPAVVCLPAIYKGTPSTLPKPVPKKAVASRPSSSRSTDEEIQGSKDALIQDLEKKLRSKEVKRRNSQKLSYEERMARRLLGPDNANSVFDQDSLSDSQLDQPDSPEGRHTGGLWGKHHCGTDERGNEGSAIQEKCYAPRFMQVPQDLTVEEGRFCRIDFKVGGLPTPDICWYLDGKAIRPDDYHKMLVCEKGMHSFIIEIITVHHAGVYECVARNRAGESRFTLRLDVIAQEALRPPTFVQKMSNFRALEGDTVRLECKVDASPPPQLFWKKDKEMLRIDPTKMSLYQDGSGRQCLLIDRVSKSDAGWYTLSAINEAGMSTCNARLDISCRPVQPMKTAPPGSKALKVLSSLSHVPAVTVDPHAQHTAPLYESEEL
ncbi:palladin isoform X1 [Syngnathus typhle]|uniref:palladin isoform X1 n=1 Tax=Syngnathus typhle TaxID=161592 RepID=UPI002A6A1DE8|nr:palladin isoform X1 [Syngnathus typhle]XP_061135474.1 palladin isoform X1 [Syngnathus typhle]